MAITVTDRAASRINEIRENKGFTKETPLRIKVVGGGCSGLTYAFDFDNEPEKAEQHDQKFEDHGIPLVVDMRSFLYLAGTELDFSEGLKGKGFHFNNPNAARTCSCGDSFSV
ncbi:iron-sulfur cluster assembly accessory protein [bacterium]|nr:MAG: iron-sulfur cluster assembly accessory protein [bacterium]